MEHLKCAEYVSSLVGKEEGLRMALQSGSSSRKMWLVQFIRKAAGGGGAISKGKELIHTNVLSTT